MSDQLTESQVARVVAEVTRQAQMRDHEQRQTLEREQVVQILDELKLPVELLDPAMVELERREAEAALQARYDEALAKRDVEHFCSLVQSLPSCCSWFYFSAPGGS